MDRKLRGSEILRILDSLSPEPLSEDIRDLYNTAYENMSINPEKAVELGQRALVTLDRLSSIPLGDSNDLAYAKGRCHLFVASVYLDFDKERLFERAEKHYLYSRDAFHSRQWSHLESLAYLGLAMACRKLKKFKEALIACKSAQDNVEHESIPNSIDTTSLRKAIQKERTEIQELLLSQEVAVEREGIPIVSDIAARLGFLTEENIVDHVKLSDKESEGVDFGVEVVEDSLIGQGIFPGDIALIHQQEDVENGDIAAVVIQTPNKESLGLLRRYFVYEKLEGLQHWLLMSSNPSREHLVVIPSGVNKEAILDLYSKEISSGKIKFYENAELHIAGKYVKSVSKH